MAKFSIVLPVRNGGEYVKECVNSILSQTISDFNLEVLDNNSKDGTLQWLTSLNDNRIRIYPSDKSLAIEENWARIVTIQKNEFMSFIGHDDCLDKNYLERMDQLILKHPTASLYQLHFRYINNRGENIRSCKPMNEVLSASEFLAFFLSNMSELSIGQMMRSTDFDEVGGIPSYPNLLFADLELWVRLIQKSYRAVSFEECCSYRIHSSSTTNSSSTLKYYDAFAKMIDFFIELKLESKSFEIVFARYGLGFLKPYCKSIAHHLLRIPRNQRKGISVETFLSFFKNKIDILIPDNNFNPEEIGSIKLAKQIDTNPLTRKLFLTFKKIYPKPIL